MNWEKVSLKVLLLTKCQKHGDLAAKVALGLAAAGVEMPRFVSLEGDSIVYEWDDGSKITIGGERE